jgi:long-chain acyl-CoA synthetase
VDRFAAGLAGLGVRTNSRVAVWMPNLPQFVIAYFATLKLGAQVVGTNPLYVERELEHQFNDAGVRVVVTLDFLWWGKLRGIVKRTPVEHVVVTSIPDYLPFPLNLLAPLKLRKTGQYVKVPREPRVHFFKELLATEAPPVAAAHSPGTIPRSCCIPAAPPASPRARCSPTGTSRATRSRRRRGSPWWCGARRFDWRVSRTSTRSGTWCRCCGRSRWGPTSCWRRIRGTSRTGEHRKYG